MQLILLNNKGNPNVVNAPKGAAFSAAGGDGWMEMQMQLKLGRCLPVTLLSLPLLVSASFEVLAPDFVRSPIWLPFKSDQIKMREKFTSLLYQTFSYGYLFLVAGTPYLSGNCL